jgi:protein-serine/threonine kinase
MTPADVVAYGTFTKGNTLSKPAMSEMKLTISDLLGLQDDSSTDHLQTELGEQDTKHKAVHDAILNCPLLPQQLSAIEPNKAIATNTQFCTKTNGCHEHSIKSIRRKNTWLNVLQNLIPGHVDDGHQKQQTSHLTSNWVEKLRREKDRLASRKILTHPAGTLVRKYGRCGDVVGCGAFGAVRVSHRTDPENPVCEQLFAVKQLKQHPRESEKRYCKRLTAEFCISSSLHHPNVVATFDLLQDAKGVYCQIMEYCSGGDLHAVILAAGQLEKTEADCFFKQLMSGVEYMHEMGVAHRDLKPGNLLLTQHGNLQITDFGNAECFRTAWETEVHMSIGVCGSAPYIAPEEYRGNKFDPRAVDIWACGIVYMAMRTGKYLWRVARKGKDASFEQYLEDRKGETGYKPIEVLSSVSISNTLFVPLTDLDQRRCRNVIYSTLDPSPTRRLTAHQVLLSEWVKKIEVCHAGNEGFCN